MQQQDAPLHGSVQRTTVPLRSQVQSMDYSCVVFDTAPTGHTLRLLQLPAMMDKALGKLVGMRGMLGGVLNQVAAHSGRQASASARVALHLLLHGLALNMKADGCRLHVEEVQQDEPCSCVALALDARRPWRCSAAAQTQQAASMMPWGRWTS
jgi:anion-transporting  ArsA/GET3 family ATPase